MARTFLTTVGQQHAAATAVLLRLVVLHLPVVAMAARPEEKPAAKAAIVPEWAVAAVALTVSLPVLRYPKALVALEETAALMEAVAVVVHLHAHRLITPIRVALEETAALMEAVAAVARTNGKTALPIMALVVLVAHMVALVVLATDLNM